ncbi:nucleotide exchange factor GrpE [Nocardioides sp. zg-578]|uniref:Protein GrpE n=2 Tax=Nocardioides marmotae TaxID=2663857 RepID=A0A6I3JFF4_9ACTN|nr:nucleotide exchange factor GrpE [Nocardioides marmotae]MCR6033196.1 nucleotide exchange factor GrpE [Gordonia jinghuaiqii]MTB83819.1 nucleotide exchange factor GrpE [Nocardioides marmotae]MTB96851.1 nucleotide exchange factor GrpE [Nocardioides marmotae]QKE03683.1 nucleotide exchange factor GrpE [Nocardioides marmotae]
MTDDPVDPVTGDAAGHVDEAGVAETPAAPGPDLAPEDVAGEPGAEGSAPDPAQDELTLTRMELAERTSDLQRLQAEFVNYKRRVERDRDLIRENATYAALTPIIEVLDTIDRARESAQHQGQELEAGFKAVAEQLERTVERLGLTKFGTAGDAFDPSLHEALSHLGEDPEVEVTTCKVIAKAGYRIGDRVVRAAQVLVADPPQ